MTPDTSFENENARVGTAGSGGGEGFLWQGEASRGKLFNKEREAARASAERLISALSESEQLLVRSDPEGGMSKLRCRVLMSLLGGLSLLFGLIYLSQTILSKPSLQSLCIFGGIPIVMMILYDLLKIITLLREAGNLKIWGNETAEKATRSERLFRESEEAAPSVGERKISDELLEDADPDSPSVKEKRRKRPVSVVGYDNVRRRGREGVVPGGL